MCSALLTASTVENESPLPLNLWMIKAQGDPQQAYEEEKQGQVCLGVNVDAITWWVWHRVQRELHTAGLTPITSISHWALRDSPAPSYPALRSYWGCISQIYKRSHIWWEHKRGKKHLQKKHCHYLQKREGLLHHDLSVCRTADLIFHRIMHSILPSLDKTNCFLIYLSSHFSSADSVIVCTTPLLCLIVIHQKYKELCSCVYEKRAS